MHRFIFSILLLLMTAADHTHAQLPVSFPSKDGITVSADWYPVNDQYPVILLCHQNRFSRGEYAETALRLNKLGFNCLAIDQRVGDEVNGIRNQTAALAKSKGQEPVFADAEQDIRAALDYLYAKYNRPVILLGSSYSASLVLKIGNNNPKVLGVVAFSPGEYFGTPDFIRKSIDGFVKPLFTTSSKAEADAVTDLVRDVNSRIKVQYIPSAAGDHGSKVLWPKSPDNEAYWIALISFLNKLKTL